MVALDRKRANVVDPTTVNSNEHAWSTGPTRLSSRLGSTRYISTCVQLKQAKFEDMRARRNHRS